jgi:CheY-like chemotaxis protein
MLACALARPKINFRISENRMTNQPSHHLILCVDDEPNALKLRKMVLEGAGYSVLTASCAKDALELFRDHRVDLVLSDHLLVGCTGTHLSQQMKQQRPEVPVAILSGVVDEPEDMSYADCFISKTAGPTEMLLAIAGLLKL